MNIADINVGEVHHYYDDGKMSESRRHDIHILEIIPYDEASNELKIIYEQEIHDCNIYSNITDYFIMSNLILDDDSSTIIYFVRDIYGGWFSICEDSFWCGRLIKI